MTTPQSAYRLDRRRTLFWILGGFCASPALLAAYGIYRSGPSEDALLGFAICLVLSVLLFWEPALQASVRVTADGLSQLSVRGRQIVRWSDVYRIEWNGLVLALRAPHRRVWINVRFLKDPAELKRIVKANVAPEAFTIDLDAEG